MNQSYEQLLSGFKVSKVEELTLSNAKKIYRSRGVYFIARKGRTRMDVIYIGLSIHAGCRLHKHITETFRYKTNGLFFYFIESRRPVLKALERYYIQIYNLPLNRALALAAIKAKFNPVEESNR